MNIFEFFDEQEKWTRALEGFMSGEMWRVGPNVPINVYEGERPVCQCRTVADAQEIVKAVNHMRSRKDAPPPPYMTFDMWWELFGSLEPARAVYAECWDAALEAVCRTTFTREEWPPPVGLPQEINDQIRAMKARV
jgi:hypothetical protein